MRNKMLSLQFWGHMFLTLIFSVLALAGIGLVNSLVVAIPFVGSAVLLLLAIVLLGLGIQFRKGKEDWLQSLVTMLSVLMISSLIVSITGWTFLDFVANVSNPFNLAITLSAIFLGEGAAQRVM